MIDTLHLFFFTKAPRPGKVKTRLAVDIGHEAAARLHASFVRTLHQTLERFAGTCTQAACVNLILARADATHHPLLDDVILGSQFGLPDGSQGHWVEHVQQGEHLGIRLQHALDALKLGEGHKDAVIIIGSDSPTLECEKLEQATALLQSHDVVIGPSFDGGYYLIGLSSDLNQSVFQDISWSTSRVLHQTLQKCKEHALSVALLDFWYDVDTKDDLELLQTHLLDYIVASTGSQHYSDVVEALAEFDRM